MPDFQTDSSPMAIYNVQLCTYFCHSLLAYSCSADQLVGPVFRTDFSLYLNVPCKAEKHCWKIDLLANRSSPSPFPQEGLTPAPPSNTGGVQSSAQNFFLKLILRHQSRHVSELRSPLSPPLHRPPSPDGCPPHF